MSSELEMMVAYTQTFSSSLGNKRVAASRLSPWLCRWGTTGIKTLSEAPRDQRDSVNEALKPGLVLQWREFMAWLFLSEASESWSDDESNPWCVGCADRIVLAALLSSHISALQWRQCSWVRQDSEMRCTWLQNQPSGNPPDYEFLKNDLCVVMALSWKKKPHKLVGQDYLWDYTVK